MGQAAARKVDEIDEVRQRLEHDLQEIEERLPAPLRSAKSLIGMLVGMGVFALFVLGRRRSKRSDRRPAAEVVVRVVREDR
jgi:hypothetical protein